MDKRLFAATTLAASAVLLVATQAAAAAVGPDWPAVGGTNASQRYTPLNQINPASVKGLDLAWERAGYDHALTKDIPDFQELQLNRNTPVVVDGVMYVLNSLGMAQAVDPKTGKDIWTQKPFPQTLKEAAGYASRGLAVSTVAGKKRVFSIRGEFLYATDASNGEPVHGFGDMGKVFLKWPTSESGVIYHNNSAPLVIGNVVVVGGFGGSVDIGGWGDIGTHKEAMPENIRGFDATTGQLLWTFHVLPQEGEEGHATWGKDSWRFMGSMGAWSLMSADDAAGVVYVPLTAPTNSSFGGHRPGDNKWGNSLVALDAKTGKLIWGFQFIHHDLWDWDTATPPVVADITVGGQRRKAVIAMNKSEEVFVLDRVTGKPIWPVVERPVPQSTVPGEASSPTQPFSTKFIPIHSKGVTEDWLVDYTPEMNAEAKEIVSHFVTGPLFIPPSVVDESPGGKKGTLLAQGEEGGGNWNSSSFDPDTGIFYEVARQNYGVYGVTKNPDPNGIAYFTSHPREGTPIKQPDWQWTPLLKNGLPLIKPPYGLLTAWNMNDATKLWSVPNGDDGRVRTNPALANVQLPPLLGQDGKGAPLVTKSLVFIADGADNISVIGTGSGKQFGVKKLRAWDKATGEMVWEHDLPSGATGAPMSYEAGGKQYVVVPIGGQGHTGWVAFALKS